MLGVLPLSWSDWHKWLLKEHVPIFYFLKEEENVYYGGILFFLDPDNISIFHENVKECYKNECISF